MARRLRNWLPGTMYHITSRGNKQAPLFYDDYDNNKYLSLLSESKELYPFTLHCYCLMKNHIHLLLETHDYPITDIMKYVNTYYAIYFNRRYNLNGHVFQGRFYSDSIKDQAHFLYTSRYIHLNPIEAEIVTSLKDYPWSSIFSYLTQTPDKLITPDRILDHFPEPKLDNYLQFLFASKMEAYQCQP